jgi:hypothetical protein
MSTILSDHTDMHWLTIYDVDSAGALRHMVAISGLVACFDVFAVLGTIRMFRPADGQVTTRQKALRITLLGLAAGLALIASLGWLYDVWRDRWDYALGRYLKVAGQVEEVRVEVTPRSSSVYFQVGKDWFKLPYSRPSACYPQEGEAVELDATETADLFHQGPPAHAIYKLRLGRECAGSKPDPREPDRPA